MGRDHGRAPAEWPAGGWLPLPSARGGSGGGSSSSTSGSAWRRVGQPQAARQHRTALHRARVGTAGVRALHSVRPTLSTSVAAGERCSFTETAVREQTDPAADPRRYRQGRAVHSCSIETFGKCATGVVPFGCRMLGVLVVPWGLGGS